MYLTEKMHVLDKLRLDMNIRDVDYEFNVNEAIIYSKQGVLKQKHI